ALAVVLRKLRVERMIVESKAKLTPASGSQLVRGGSVPEIFEICGDAEVAAAHELNDSLQLVFLLAGDANLPVPQLALHFEPLGLDRLDNFFGFVPFQALLDLQFLSAMADG